MDAATAAAMSDPDRNRFFRRRWRETWVVVAAQPRPATDPAERLELAGQDLLREWRRERAQRQADSAISTDIGLGTVRGGADQQRYGLHEAKFSMAQTDPVAMVDYNGDHGADLDLTGRGAAP
jgi:hypothetical protein